MGLSDLFSIKTQYSF